MRLINNELTVKIYKTLDSDDCHAKFLNIMHQNITCQLFSMANRRSKDKILQNVFSKMSLEANKWHKFCNYFFTLALFRERIIISKTTVLLKTTILKPKNSCY